MKSDLINIVIVDDSPVFIKFLLHIIQTAPDIHVSGTASNGMEAIEQVQRLKPQVVLMDIHMPGLDGFETTAQIMNLCPTPVIIISSDYSPEEVAKTFRAFEVGAVDILPKPPGIDSSDHMNSVQKLITHIRLMSEIKVVTRSAVSKKNRDMLPKQSADILDITFNSSLKKFCDIIGIGTSAGGPMAIQKLLQGLSNDFLIPVVIVQHIEPMFADGFAQWLETTTGKKILIGKNGMMLEPGMIVLPPGDSHIGFLSPGILEISQNPPDHGLRPSVHHLFTDIANTYGNNSIGILLTGMGSDGVQALKLMKDKGAVTIAQDAESSMIHGMPGEAIKAGAVKYEFTLEQIIKYLNGINRQRKEL